MFDASIVEVPEIAAITILHLEDMDLNPCYCIRGKAVEQLYNIGMRI